MAGRKSTAFMELAIGATIIAGVVILVVMLMAWGNSLSLLGSRYRVLVGMANVGGLKEGAPVKMGGFQIGRVASIQIRPGSTEMELVLDIDDNRDLPKDSTGKVSTAGLVGDAFMEIVPGKSPEMLAKAATAAEADHIESTPLPDMSELMVKVNSFGEQLNILTANLNDIVGDIQFRKSLKSMAVNLDNVSYQANLILQRSQSVVDNINTASKNVADLSVTLKDGVEKAGADISRISGSAEELLTAVKDKATGTLDNIERVTGSAGELLDTVKGRAEGTLDNIDHITGSASELLATVKTRTEGTLDNLDAGVTDIRNAVNSTIGSPEVAKNLAGAIANINSVTALLAKRNDATEQLLLNLGDMTDNLKAVSVRVRAISEGVDPASVSATLASLNSAIGSMSSAIDSMTEVVDKVKAEPVLALSINKAADRIVKMKFDEMAKQRIRDADSTLEEVNRWVRKNMDQGVFDDPAYSHETRPYVLPERASPQITGGSASERQSYMIE